MNFDNTQLAQSSFKLENQARPNLHPLWRIGLASFNLQLSEFFSFFKLLLLFLLFWPDRVACGILVPQPEIEPGPSATKALSPSH